MAEVLIGGSFIKKWHYECLIKKTECLIINEELTMNSLECLLIKIHFTQSPNHPITQSPNHPITQSPNHPITQTPKHGITTS
ncbi:MAG: hypothetical protein ACI82Q_002744, partial [Nonlabens sp.]